MAARAFASFCNLAGLTPEEPPSNGAVANALAAIESTEARAELALSAAWLGKRLTNSSKPEFALRCFTVADAMFEALGPSMLARRAANAGEHGVALRRLHRFEEAEERYEFARLHLPSDAQEAQVALAVASALLCRDTGRPEQAVALLKSVEAQVDAVRHPQMLGWIIANLAMTEDMPGERFAQAILRLQRARTLLGGPGGEPQRLAEIEQSLALAMQLQGDASSREAAASALARTAARPNPDVAWRALETLALGSWGAGNRDFAIVLLKLAIDTIQLLRARRADADETLKDLSGAPVFSFDALALMLAQQGRHGEARWVMATKLATMAAAADPEPPSCTEDEEWATLRLHEAMAEQAQRFAPDQLSVVIARTAEELGRRAAAAASAIRRLNDRIGDELRRAIPVADRANTVVLLCMQNMSEVRIALEADGRTLTLGPPADAGPVNRLANDFLVELLRGQTSARERLGRTLADLLLEPVLRHVPPGARRLAICAPGPLHGLPWAALPWRDGYLVQHFDLVRASALGTDLTRPPRSPMHLIAGGCSVPGATPLPHAASEVNSLGANMALTEPEEFTRTRLRDLLPGATVLHLATHFEAEPARLGDSRLLMGDGNHLTLSDLSGLSLSHLDLIVLSACDSGVSGGMTDPRAFAVDHLLMSGRVPAVLGMLYPVHDEAMSIFMQRFYDRLRGGSDKAAALAAVQREFLSGAAGVMWRAPFFWAAPVLSGNWLGWPAMSPKSDGGQHKHLRLVEPS